MNKSYNLALEEGLKFMDSLLRGFHKSIESLLTKKKIEKSSVPPYYAKSYSGDRGIFRIVYGKDGEMISVLYLKQKHKSVVDDEHFDIRVFEQEHCYMLNLPHLNEPLIMSTCSLFSNGHEILHLTKVSETLLNESVPIHTCIITIDFDSELGEYTLSVNSSVFNTVAKLNRSSGVFMVKSLLGKREKYPFPELVSAKTNKKHLELV